MARLPILARTGIHTFFNGPESFTPDDRYLLGEAPELKNFFVAAGFNSIGIQSAGGAGKALAEWMHAGEPTMDLMGVDIRRMLPFQGNKTYLVNRVTETLGLLYADHFPYRHYESARGVRHSPLHERLAARGACFGEAAGWERPYWYLPESARAKGETPEYRYSWKRQNWFDYAAAEHKAVRTGVGALRHDAVRQDPRRGPRRRSGAAAHLRQRHRGGARPHRLYAMAERATAASRPTSPSRASPRRSSSSSPRRGTVPRDLAWLKRHIPDDARCVATDVTVGRGVPRRHGSEVARAAAAAASTSTSRTPPSRSARRRRSRSAWARRARTASPMSASWAGRSTSPPTWRGTCSTPSSARGDGAGPQARRHARARLLPHREGLPPFRPRHRPTRTMCWKPGSVSP